MASHPQDTGFFSCSNLQAVLDYIEENLLEELTLAIISAHFYVSASTLSTLFKTVCGMTVMEYIRNRRLTLAAEALSSSDASILDLAYQYGYDTPEAFTKAFSRFHGFPPSFVRRGFPVSNIFLPMHVSVSLEGGWNCSDLTKSDCAGQDQPSHFPYNTFIRDKDWQMASNSQHKTASVPQNAPARVPETARNGGHAPGAAEIGERKMINRNTYRIDLDKMQFQQEWGILCSLADSLLQSRIPFKVDGKTMLFAHGLEFPLDKICLTFKWGDEAAVKDFFHYNAEVRHGTNGFKYFDALYSGMRIRCMFYGDCPGADTDAFLYRNTDVLQMNGLMIPVQSLEFYYENAEKETPYYKMVAKRLGRPENYRMQNKHAWEYSAYKFWLQNSGLPSERAKKDLENPLGMLKKYAAYFDSYAGVRIANICGSCGKKAVPLAILGAEVTVFDISEENRKYALEVAEAANVKLGYEVCDILELNRNKYGNYFDVVFMEGGVLHYFHDLDAFMRMMYVLLKSGGKMICSDFHPFSKISDILHFEQPSMSYFSTAVFEGEMPHARFYPETVRKQMPKCLYRKYTVSEIINTIINCGFLLERFDEHPAWTNEAIPGEFTVVARKES